MRLRDVPLEVLQEQLDLPLHDFLGIVLTDLEPVTVEMAVTDQVASAVTPVHGGALCTLVDVAANIAAATSERFLIGRSRLVTRDLAIRFVHRPQGGLLRACAEVADDGTRWIRTTCEVHDDTGRQIATAETTCLLLRGRRDPTEPSRR